MTPAPVPATMKASKLLTASTGTAATPVSGEVSIPTTRPKEPNFAPEAVKILEGFQLQLAQAKEDSGGTKKLVVTGCLTQRYEKELIAELPEVVKTASGGVGCPADTPPSTGPFDAILQKRHEKGNERVKKDAQKEEKIHECFDNVHGITFF